MGETVVTDGRVNRSARTRTAVVDALLALIDAGTLRPTAREVATKAGVSLRSVYVHFDDVESLFVTASERHFEHLQTLVKPCDPSAPLDDRIRELVAQRLRIYADGAQVRRAAVVQAPFSQALRQALEFGRRAGREEAEAVFARELAAASPGDRARLSAALEAALGASTWDTLTTAPDLADGDVAEVMGGLVRAALATWGRPAADDVGDIGDHERPSSTAGPG